MLKHYATMVFDVGGTLLRLNLDLLARTYQEECAARGVSLDFQQTRSVIQELELELPKRQQQRPVSLEEGYGAGFWDAFYLEGFRRLKVTQDMAAAAAHIRERFQRAEFETLFDDVLPALQALAQRRVTFGILSNFSPNCEDVLRQVSVHQYFSFFVVSALAGFEKPDPRIFKLVIHAASRDPSEIVYVGDSLFHDIEGARRAGMDTILVDRNNRYPDFEGMKVRDLRDLANYTD